MSKINLLAEHEYKQLAVQFAVLWGSEMFDILYFESAK